MLSFSSLLLADAGVWYAFANSDGMGKGIVFLLFISSMVAWFIMIEKGLALYRAQKLSERFAAAFNEQHGMNGALRDGMENPCPVAKVYISGMEQLLEFYGQTPEEIRHNSAMRSGRGPRKLSPAQLDAVQTAMEREISGQIFIIEERIGMLATAVSLAPFLGLFGTVWGVMIAFCGVASAGSANIQALAPGVAGALLTTVAGLVVAIPSLVGYNFLTQMIRKITVSMDNFSESFMARLKLEQLVARDEDTEKNISGAAGEFASAGRSQTAAQIPVNAAGSPVRTVPAATTVQGGGNFNANVSSYASNRSFGNYQNVRPVQEMAQAPSNDSQYYNNGNNYQSAPVPGGNDNTPPRQMSFGNMPVPGSENDDTLRG